MITYSDCLIVALITQHAVRMLHIILSPVACLALPHFSTFSHKRNDFFEKVTEDKISFHFSLRLMFDIFLIVRRYQRDCDMNVHRSSCYTCQLLMKLGIFPDRLSKNIQASNFMKSRPVGAKLLHADGQTDMTNKWSLFAILRTLLKHTK